MRNSPHRSMTTCVTAVVNGSTSRKLAPWPWAVAVSMRPPMALTSARTTSMPTPRPASSDTLSAVLKPAAKIICASSASDASAPSANSPVERARSRMRARSSPAPSSRNSTPTSLPSWLTLMRISPLTSLPAATRTSGLSMPCTTQLRSRCSKGAVMRSSTPRSTSMAPPTMSSRTCLPVSFAAWRTTRYSRSAMPSNSTMRVRSRSSCRSRVSRACAASSSSVACSDRCSPRCTVATSLTDSAIMRVSSWKRVKRSISSGSKPCAEALAASMRELICDSACSSRSRSWRRSRSRLSVRSTSEPLIWPTSDSMRARVMLTSPAWLTRRSSSGPRTRTAAIAVGVARSAWAAGSAAPAVKRPQSIDPAGAETDTAPGAPMIVGGGSSVGASSRASASAGAAGAVGGRDTVWLSGAITGKGAVGSGAASCAAAAIAGRPSCSKLPAMASTRDISRSTSAASTPPRASRCSMAVSSRCAISPRRIAPARRAPPLKVCRVRMQAEAAVSSLLRRAQSRMRCCSCGSSSSPSSWKIGPNSSSSASSASMSSSSSSASARAWMTGACDCGSSANVVSASCPSSVATLGNAGCGCATASASGSASAATSASASTAVSVSELGAAEARSSSCCSSRCSSAAEVGFRKPAAN